MLVTSTEFLHCDCLIMKAMCTRAVFVCVCERECFAVVCLPFFVCFVYIRFLCECFFFHFVCCDCEPAVHQFECATGHCASMNSFFFILLLLSLVYASKAFSVRQIACLHKNIQHTAWTSLWVRMLQWARENKRESWREIEETENRKVVCNQRFSQSYWIPLRMKDRYVNKNRKAFQIRGMINIVNAPFLRCCRCCCCCIDSIDRFLFTFVFQKGAMSCTSAYM